MSGTAEASIGSDRANIARIEQEISAQGARAQALVTRYNEAQAHLSELNAQIASDQRLVATNRGIEADAASAMRRVAVEAYTSGSELDSPTIAMVTGTWSVITSAEQNQYLGAVNGKLDAKVATLRLARARAQDAERNLESEQAQARATVRELAAARDAASAAIASEEAQLTSVKGDLGSLIAADSARRRADQLAAERALAAATPPAPLPPPPSPPQSSPPPPTTSPTSAGYANPFRSVTALTPERIDQGVDFSGFGPIYAIGNGVVLNTVSGGWPGGTFIAYRLTDGPASGRVVYAAEDIQPYVQVGQTVSSGTVLGQMYTGPEGIEIGWANGASLPDTMARTYGQFDGSNPSAFGDNFSRFLQSLGAPGGIASGAPSGVIPSWWPTW